MPQHHRTMPDRPYRADGGELGSEELGAGERGAVSSESWELASCELESWELGCCELVSCELGSGEPRRKLERARES